MGRTKEKLDQVIKAHGEDIANGGQMIPITADTTSKESIQNLVSEISKKEKYVNVLVNNAGINTEHRQEVEKGDESAQALHESLWSATVEEWEDAYRTNVIGYVHSEICLTRTESVHSATILPR